MFPSHPPFSPSRKLFLSPSHPRRVIGTKLTCSDHGQDDYRLKEYDSKKTDLISRV